MRHWRSCSKLCKVLQCSFLRGTKSKYLYFGVHLNLNLWQSEKEEIHSHFSLIIMQFSHRTFENFSSLNCTARDSSSYLVAWNDGQFILSTDWRRVKVWAHPLPQFNLLGSIFYITLRYDFKLHNFVRLNVQLESHIKFWVLIIHLQRSLISESFSLWSFPTSMPNHYPQLFHIKWKVFWD